MQVAQVKELTIKATERVGQLADISKLMSEQNINLRAISAWIVGNESFFRIISSDNEKAKKILTDNDYQVQEQEVIVVKASNEVGQLAEITSKLKQEQINITHLYATVANDNDQTSIVMSCSDNQHAIEVLS
jgi:hypothetical protein